MTLQYTGQPQNVQLTQDGSDVGASNPIPVETASVVPTTNVSSSAYEKSHVVSNAPCTLVSWGVTNKGVSDLWLLVFDATALPANGTVPSRRPIPVPAGYPGGDERARGTSLAVGCVLALSTTSSSLTLVGTDDGWFDAEVAS